MNKKKWLSIIVIIVSISLILAACSNDEATNTPDAKGNTGEKELSENQVLNFAQASELPTLDLLQATDIPSFTAIRHLKSGLMRINEDSEPVPDMAAEMPKVNEDRTEYTFTIREDAVWSNGDPVTAHDFEFAWKKVVDPDTASGMSYIFEGAAIENASKIMNQDSDMFGEVDQLGVEALDDKTLQVTLDSSTPFFLSLMGFTTFLPINEEFYNQQGEGYGQEPENVLYNGPFTLAEWDHGSSWTYAKNPDYWDAENVHLDQVKYSVVGELSTQLNLYTSGQLSSVGLTSEFVPQYQETEEFMTSLGGPMQFIRLNTDRVDAFKNDKVRDAIKNAIDREEMTNIVLNNGAVPAQYIVAKEYAFGPNGEDFREKAPEGYNIKSLEEAKQLWQEGLKEVGTETVEVEFMTVDASTTIKLAEYIKNQLETNLPGIQLTINTQPLGNYLATESNMDYEMAMLNWYPDFQDPINFLEPWTTGQFWNRTGWSNEEYDQLIQEAKSLGSNPEERWQVLHEAEELFMNEAPVVPLYQIGSSFLQKTNIKDLQRSPVFDWTYAYIEQQ